MSGILKDMKTIFIGSDHAGFELKSKIIESLKTSFRVIDKGCFTKDSVDYPDFADQVCQNISSSEFGILVCGSGQGMAMRANKYTHIRAALVYNIEIAKLAREHNDANVICLGSRFIDFENAYKCILEFLNTDFAQGRHQQRVAKVSRPTP